MVTRLPVDFCLGFPQIAWLPNGYPLVTHGYPLLFFFQEHAQRCLLHCEYFFKKGFRKMVAVAGLLKEWEC